MSSRRCPFANGCCWYPSACATSWSASSGPSARSAISLAGHRGPSSQEQPGDIYTGASRGAELPAPFRVLARTMSITIAASSTACRLRFRCAAALTPADLAAVAEQVRRRVLRWFVRRGWLDTEDARDMLGWANTGFSLDAPGRSGGRDRAGLSFASRERNAIQGAPCCRDPGDRAPGGLRWALARSRLPELNVCYLESSRERLPGPEGPE